MQNHSDKINQLNRQRQALRVQLEEKRNQINSHLERMNFPHITEDHITFQKNSLNNAEAKLLNSRRNLVELENKLTEAKQFYEKSNSVAKTHFKRWIDQYMPHLSNQELFIDAFIRENKDFQYTPFEEPGPYDVDIFGPNPPRKDPACLYVEQYNESFDAKRHGKVNLYADPIFHLNEHKALESIRSSISQCQSESDVVELFQRYLVYGLGNEAHMNAVLAMANYFFSNKSRVANQNDTDMNARLGHFLHYIQANDAGQYNFSEKIPDNGWITSNYKKCFENLFQSRKILLSIKWDEFGRLKDRCAAVSVQRKLVEGHQRQVDVYRTEVGKKHEVVNKIRDTLNGMITYNQLYDELSSIDSQIEELNNQISNLSNDPIESKQPQSGSNPSADENRLNITAPASGYDSPLVVKKKSSNLCGQVEKHYQSIKKKESDLWMTTKSINARISAADNELKGMDFSNVSESDFVNKHAKFGLGGIFTMKRFSYILKMRYRHEKFLKDSRVNESKIYNDLMRIVLEPSMDVPGNGDLFNSLRGDDGLRNQVSLSTKNLLNDYFKTLKDSSLFSGRDGYNRPQDFSKALHIQDRLQLLSKYLAKSPEERIHFCSSFQASDACEMRGQRKGRFLIILSRGCLEDLKEKCMNANTTREKIDEIINHLDGLPVSSVVKVYEAIQSILVNSNYQVQWDSHFWQLSRRRQEGQLDEDLGSLLSQVQQARRDEEANEAISQSVAPLRSRRRG